MLRVLVIFLSLLATGLALSSPAAAHAVLLSTEPADRTVLSAPPQHIVLRFNEAVAPIAVRVIDGTGKTVNDTGGVHALNNDVEVALAGSLPNGTYLLSYRVTSADSHPVAGSFLFAVGPPPASWSATAQSAGEGAEPSDWSPFVTLNRLLLLASALLTAGGSLFLVFVAGGNGETRRLLRPTINTAAIVAMLTAGLAIGLQGGLLAGAPLASFVDGAIWRLGLSATRSLQSITLFAGCSAILVGLAGTSQRFGNGLLAAGALTVTASFALSGHMATATPPWAMLPALCVHVTVAAFWLGSFLPLLAEMKRNNAQGLIRARRFSAIAVIAVPLLIAAGIVMGCAWIDEPAALVTSDYGRLLLAKAILVAILLVLAAINRFRLLPRLAGGTPLAAARLRTTIKAEIVVGVTIVIATVWLSQTPPHGAVDHGAHLHEARGAEPQGYTAVVPLRGRLAVIQVSPAGSGSHSVEVTVSNERGEAAGEASEAALFLSNPTLGVEPTERRMFHDGAGAFSYQGPEFAIPGNWVVRADVLFGDFEKGSFETTVPLP